MMWRYVVGGCAALLLAAAGLFLFRGSAASDARALPPAPAQAAEAPPLPVEAPRASDRSREQKRFDRYDKDHDEAITRDEYLASRRKAFARLDTNGDGKLSFDEWAVRTTTRFDGADKDRSGSLTRTEFATTAPKPRRTRPRCACPPAPTRDAGASED